MYPPLSQQLMWKDLLTDVHTQAHTGFSHIQEAFHSNTVHKNRGMPKKKRKTVFLSPLLTLCHRELGCNLRILYRKHTPNHTLRFRTNRWQRSAWTHSILNWACKDLWEICSWNAPFIHWPLNLHRTMMLTHIYECMQAQYRIIAKLSIYEWH